MGSRETGRMTCLLKQLEVCKPSAKGFVKHKWNPTFPHQSADCYGWSARVHRVEWQGALVSWEGAQGLASQGLCLGHRATEIQ